MNKPGPISQFAGYPPFTLALFGGYGYIGYEFHEGVAGIIPLVLAIGFAIGTLKAAARMSSYRRWSAAWDAMGGGAPRKTSRVHVVVWSIAILGGVPFALPYLPNHPRITDGLALVWLAVFVAACVFVLVKLSRGGFSFVRSSANRSRDKAHTKADAAPVSWMLGRASSSPSRKDAIRQLPDYTRKVLNAKPQASRLAGSAGGEKFVGASRR